MEGSFRAVKVNAYSLVGVGFFGVVPRKMAVLPFQCKAFEVVNSDLMSRSISAVLSYSAATGRIYFFGVFFLRPAQHLIQAMYAPVASVSICEIQIYSNPSWMYSCLIGYQR